MSGDSKKLKDSKKTNLLKFVKYYFLWFLVICFVFSFLFFDSGYSKQGALGLVLFFGVLFGFIAAFAHYQVYKKKKGQVKTEKPIQEKKDFLNEKLSKVVRKEPFYPDAFFYSQYYKDPQQGLQYMAGVLFEWLKIKPNGCILTFFNEKEMQSQKSPDAAGFYTKIKDDEAEKEVILINSKYYNDPIAVAAILAHEIMHLYLFRLNIKLEDTLENEKLTDLATINTGLSILILNGMSYSSQWWLTIILIFFGIRYWHSEQLSFGYFKPKEYANHAINYFNEKSISIKKVLNYTNPYSRYFLGHGTTFKSESPTEYIRALEKRRNKSTFIKVAVVASIIALIYLPGVFGSSNTSSSDAGSQSAPMKVQETGYDYQKSGLNTQIDTCKSEASQLENTINTDQGKIQALEEQMSGYKLKGSVSSYNALVDTHNALVDKVKTEITSYDLKVDKCNELVRQYNLK